MRKQILKIFQQNEQTAISLNTDQLWAGKLADGSDMPQYSPISIQVFGKRPGPWQAYDSGDLYRGIFMNASKFPIMFGSTSLHTGIFAEHLAAKGGNADEIFGLTKTNLNELSREYVLPELQYFVRSIIQL